MSKTHKYVLFLILIIFCIIIFWASESTLWIGDDYNYKFCYEEDGISPYKKLYPTPIENVGDIFSSQYHHYFIGNGRAFAHVLVQLFCGLLGKTWFAVLNSLVYIGLIIILIYLIRNNLNSFKTWISVIILIIFSLLTKITPSTQIGYIWIGTLNLVFIWLFLYFKATKWWEYIIIGIFALLIGNGHESYSSGISLAIIIYWLVNIRSYSLTKYILSISYGLGALFICLSPASLARVGQQTDIFQSLFFFLFSLRAVYILLIIVLYKIFIEKISFKSIYSQNSFYWNIIFGCILFNLLVGVISHRQLFGAELMAIILILKLSKDNTFNNLGFIVIGVLSVCTLYLNIERVYIQHKQEKLIFSKFENSNDGKVYQDTWGPGLFEGWASYFWENDLHSNSFASIMRISYPGSPKLVILPTFLENKDTIDLGNMVYHFNYKPGKLLLIQSKQSPAKFYVKREFFGLIQYQVREIDFSHPWYEGEKWKAIVYDELNPIIYNTDVIIKEQ